MTASEHLALCEGKRGGATAEERALCAELEAAEKALIEADKPCLAWIARAEAAEKDVRILTEASRANEDMIERARGSVPVERLENLAPCECGRPAKLQGTQIVEGRATRWYARCELSTCWFGPERDSPERAAESWNRRALRGEGK